MATIIKVRRLATSATNPRRLVVRKPHAKNAVKRQRKITPKRVRISGTKRKAPQPSSHRSRSVPNGKRSPNPAWVITLGPVAGVNPNKRSNTTMAARKKSAKRTVKAHRKTRRVVAKNTHRPRTKVRTVTKYKYRKTNPKIVYRYRKTRTNRKKHHVVRRNPPEIFGARLGSKDSLKMIGGGIAGVAATKFLPTVLPTQFLGTVATSNIGRTAISFVAAWISGFAASKLDARFGQGVYFGGFMQTASVALNAFVPSLYQKLGVGMGDFVPGQFAVPQNPVRQISAPAHAVAPSGSRVTMSGLARAYTPAY